MPRASTTILPFYLPHMKYEGSIGFVSRKMKFLEHIFKQETIKNRMISLLNGEDAFLTKLYVV
jgi:hypothetical protein